METAAADHARRNPPLVVSSSEAVKVTSPDLPAGAPRRRPAGPCWMPAGGVQIPHSVRPPPEGHISRGPRFVAAPVAGAMALASRDRRGGFPRMTHDPIPAPLNGGDVHGELHPRRRLTEIAHQNGNPDNNRYW